MPVVLRDYQQAAVDAVRMSMRRHRRVLLCMPTRSGKTVCFAHIAHAVAERGKRVYIRAHRIEIIEQISETLLRTGVDHGIIAPGYRQNTRPVQVAMVQTLKNRMAYLPKPDLGITDECHHGPASSYRWWDDIYELGVTATPGRLDGAPLGDCYDDLVFGPSMKQLQAMGHLAPYRYFAPPQVANFDGVRKVGGDLAKGALGEIMGQRNVLYDAESHYRRLMPGQPCVGFWPTVESAEKAAEEFRALGWNAASVDGSMDPAERKRRVRAVGNGGLQLLMSCDVISEGVDLPSVMGAILGRRTDSLTIFLQQVGRPLNPNPDGSPVNLIDLVGNVFNGHGMPNDDRHWSLTTGQPRTTAAAVKQCPACYLVFPPAPRCPACGHVIVAQAKPRTTPKTIKGELHQVTEIHRCTGLTDTVAPLPEVMRLVKTANDLIVIQKARGYHHGWIRRQLDMRPKLKYVDERTGIAV